MITVEYDDESRMWYVIKWDMPRTGRTLAKCRIESDAEDFAQSYRLKEVQLKGAQ